MQPESPRFISLCKNRLYSKGKLYRIKVPCMDPIKIASKDELAQHAKVEPSANLPGKERGEGVGLFAIA